MVRERALPSGFDQYDLAPSGPLERALMDLPLSEVLALAAAQKQSEAILADFQAWIDGDDSDAECSAVTVIVHREVA